ncbi:heme peroxidase [Tolypothrix sp. NIES-4075]|uniref:peroxidase family protein n=1 Tax=Tolypothrix sp. NIES-4075 TaxID=2005459 RepID=UPI000B5CF49A|nr:peroxidase family protein [Tolypothrix sp. NIES-4075]GAX43301.1 heme peroxidase [Tolypothrix sp. NIES-4075]
MTKSRSTINDGLRNKLEGYVLTHFKWFWDFVQSNNFLKRRINKFIINNAIYKAPTRPYPLSTMAPYTSWDSLSDRTYNGRHLPPVEENVSKLPSWDELSELFRRKEDTILSTKSTLLFPYFAQWFTDGFLRIDRNNFLKNTSNHEIDVSPLYGLKREVTNILRSHEGGKLKSQFINGEEYPQYYFQDGVVKEEFKDLEVIFPPELDQTKKEKMFAVGKERGNVQIGYVMINTLFLREHNRICDILAKNYSNWDDERLFQTARNIIIVLLIQIVVEEYVNHIAPYYFKFIADPKSFTNEKWYRQNWMTVEFDLLYRWHSLTPNEVYLDSQKIPMTETLWNNDMVTSRGLGNLFENASLQPAGQMGVFNTAPFLLETDWRSIQLGRVSQLASYNDYRELCKFPRVTDFDQITGNIEAQKLLKRFYGHVDNIEYYVGIFAEDTRENSATGPLIGRLVGVDAFSQALTNPLLAENVFNEKTFSPVGMEIIQTSHSLSDVLHRNIPQTNKKFQVTMTQGK